MKTLSHEQQIKVAGFRFKKFIKIVTISGVYNKKCHEKRMTFEEYAAQNTRNGGKDVWTHQESSVLTDNYQGKSEYIAKKAEAYENALEIVNGEVVSIEGNEYVVKVNGERYSDSVYFVLVAKEVK